MEKRFIILKHSHEGGKHSRGTFERIYIQTHTLTTVTTVDTKILTQTDKETQTNTTHTNKQTPKS